MISTSDDVAPVVKRIELACSPAHAFEVFTRRMSEWWPLATHSVYGDDASEVTFGSAVGEEIIELSRAGDSCSWGTITAYRTGDLVAFTWHPGLEPEKATHVEVRFTPTADGTLVELTHGGWERRDQAAERRAGYDVGWDGVLARYVEVARV